MRIEINFKKIFLNFFVYTKFVNLFNYIFIQIKIGIYYLEFLLGIVLYKDS